jgi:hypothetical protein
MAATMSTCPQSQLIGKFANVKVGYNWHDGDEVIVGEIIRQDGTKFVVRSKSGREYIIEISDIRNLINITETQKYKVGDTVEAVVDYHWKDGEEYGFGQITGVTQFGNEIQYSVYIFKKKATLSISQNNIRRCVVLQTAKFVQNQRVGVKHCDGHPYFYDTYVKNGTITSVDAGYDRVTYSVKYDDGTSGMMVSESSITTPAIIKTSAQKEQEYAEYLRSEEQRLLQQLQNVRLQMHH